MDTKKTLKAFLYLMMRDHVPTGVIYSVIESAAECSDVDIVYSNIHLAALAEDYAGRLIEYPQEPQSPAPEFEGESQLDMEEKQ